MIKLKLMNNLLKQIENIPKPIPLIAITGMCKNAGKTTFLNYLSDNLAQAGNLALLTTGRDGEDYDLVGGHEKPKVLIKQNSIFVTHSNILERFSGKVEILFKSDYKAGSFSIWVARALQDLETEIVGPSTAKEQVQLANKIRDFKPRFIIIDGSLDRKAITLRPDIDLIILVVSANYGSLKEIITELKRLLLLTEIQEASYPQLNDKTDKLLLLNENKLVLERTSLLGNEKDLVALLNDNQLSHIYIPGVITDSIWEKVRLPLLKQKISLIVNHPYQLQLSYYNLSEITKNMDIKAINNFHISALALNSFSVKGRHLDAKILHREISKLTSIPIIDSMEVY